MEGTRPVLVEIQSLIAPSSLGTPRRAVVGWDSGRLAMLLAVLQARCGLSAGGADVYLNVAGGLRIGEPAADLAVAAALLSSLADRPVPGETVVFGEVGLSGEVRPVVHAENRLKEAAKLGFTRAIVPRRRRGRDNGKSGEAGSGKSGEAGTGMTVEHVGHLSDLLGVFGIEPGGEAWLAQAHSRAQAEARSQAEAGAPAWRGGGRA
jgi:DNA repair protein RadA/Sms